MPTHLSDLRLRSGGSAPQTGQDFTGAQVTGQLHFGVLSAPGGLAVNVVYRQDDNGQSGELGCAELLGGPPELSSLMNRLRIGVATTDNVTWVEMMTAHVPARGERASKKNMTQAQLDAAVGGSAAQFLVEKGVSSVGTREDLLGDTSRRRGFLAATFPGTDSVDALLWVLAVSRVLPVLRQVETGTY